ncbi:MAG: hypothetical protein RL173_2434 [Fibrobacterota bacterium]
MTTHSAITLLTSSVFAFSGGDGSASKPFLVGTLDELSAMRDHPSSHFRLIADIDASPTRRWNDSGTDNRVLEGWKPFAFSGSLDGDGHGINGLSIDRQNESMVGLFSRLGESDTNSRRPGHLTLPTAKVVRLTMDSARVHGKTQVGILAGNADFVAIRQVFVSGSSSGTERIGQLCGTISNAQLTAIRATGSVKGNDVLGGIAGEAQRMWSHGIVSESVITGIDTLGGLFGLVREATLGIHKRWTPLQIDTPATTQPRVPQGIRAQLHPFQGLGEARTWIQVASFRGSITGRDHIGGAIGVSTPLAPSVRYLIVSGHIRASDFVGGMCGSCAWDGTHRRFENYEQRHIIASGSIRASTGSGVYGDTGAPPLGVFLASRRSDPLETDPLAIRREEFGCKDLFGQCDSSSHLRITDPLDDRNSPENGGRGEFGRRVYDDVCLLRNPECLRIDRRFASITWPRKQGLFKGQESESDSTLREWVKIIYPFGDLPPAQRDRQIKLARGQCHDLRPRFIRLGQDSITFVLDPAVEGQEWATLSKASLCIPGQTKSDTLWLAAKSSRELTRFFVTTISDSSVRAR